MSKQKEMLKKKYLVTATTFPKYVGDSAPRFVLDICIALQQQGVTILVLAPHAKGSKFSEVIEGVNVVRYPYFFPFGLERLSGEGIVAKLKRNPLLNIILPFFLLSQLFFTALCIARFRPDHVLAYWVVPQGLIAYLLGIVNRRMRYSVVSLGGDAVLINKNVAIRQVARLILKRATQVIAISSNIKKKLIDAGVFDAKVNIVSMGVWLSEVSIRVNRDIDFVFVGRLEEKKGVEYFIDALYQLHKDGMRFNAVIVGNGTLYGELSKRVAQSGLNDTLHLTGSLPLNEVRNILRRSKIFVLPSINLADDVEGMPTIILDAMSQKTAVVATDAGGVTDVVINNVNGILVPQKQPSEIALAIKILLADEVMRNNLVVKAYELIKSDFTYAVIAKKLIRIIE
jgi:glycosyltransferase involved in cell wall biosynthesis